MGQNRRDKQWPRPRTTRFVWVAQPSPQVPPVQGYVLDWRRQSYRWSALVVTVRLEDDQPVVVQEWVAASDCDPCGAIRTAEASAATETAAEPPADLALSLAAASNAALAVPGASRFVGVADFLPCSVRMPVRGPGPHQGC